MTSPRITWEITAGNLASMATTAALIIGAFWALSGRLTDLEGKDKQHELRIERIESDMGRSRADHDLLIEIRQDLKLLRQQFDAPPRTRSSP